VSEVLAEVRARRVELQAREDVVSYVRRLAQGRLDIARAELRRRTEGAPPSDLATDLAAALGDEGGGGSARPPRDTTVGVDEPLVVELEAVCAAVEFGSVRTMDAEALAGVVERLAEFEARCSSLRRELFAEIDALTSRLVSGYRSGEADVDALLDDADRQ
jgi:hypothetical protein